MKPKNERKRLSISDTPSKNSSVLKTTKLHYRSKTSRLVAAGARTVKNDKIDKKRLSRRKPRIPATAVATAATTRSSPVSRHQVALKLRHPIIKKIHPRRVTEDEEEEEEEEAEEDEDETNNDEEIDGEDDDDDDDDDVQEIEDIDVEEEEDDEEGEEEEEEEDEEEEEEEEESEVEVFQIVDSDNESSESVIVLENESDAPPQDRSISIIYSPPKKFLSMARKSTSPLKIAPKSLTTNLRTDCGSDILEKRDLFKTEKAGTSVTTTSNGGKLLNQNATRKRSELIPNKQQQATTVLSTSGLIDYFIMGSKELGKSLLASQNASLNNSNSLEEFRKACKIYAEIALRQRYHPSFLNRNLSYLVEERNKSLKRKRRFKIDNLLKMKTNELSTFNDTSEVLFKVVSIDIKNQEDKEKISKSNLNKHSFFSFRCYAFRGNENFAAELGPLTIDRFEIRKTGEVILVPKSTVQELKINSYLYPFVCIELKVGPRTLRSVYSIDKLFPKSNATTELTVTLLENEPTTKETLKSTFNSTNLVKLSIKRSSRLKATSRQPSQSQLVFKSAANGTHKIIKKEKSKSTTTKQVYYLFTSANTNKHSETKILTCHSGMSNPFECPFCHLSTLASETTLLNHLTHSHPRFAAQIVANTAETIRIEIMIDPLYDASYASKHEHHLLGYPQNLHGPRRLIDYMIRNTHVIVNKRVTNLYLAKCRGHSDFEIIEKQVIAAAVEQALKNDDANINRVFYHTNTWQPVRSERELEQDSDDETAPEWLREHTRLLINDFSDLNEGEKWFMHAWNMHCLNSHTGIYNRQVMDVCASFITRETANIVRASLQRNFISHLRDLIDYGLLTVDAFIRLVDLFNEMIRNLNSNK